MGLLESITGRRPLRPGDDAPELTAVDQDGNRLNLGELFKEGATLIFFYPMASTAGCTAQACSLRDTFPELRARSVRVLGVSTDKESAQKRFQKNQRLPFPLLADTKQEITRAFGVPCIFGFVARQSFLIRDGKIAAHFQSAETSGHGAEVLAILDGH